MISLAVPPSTAADDTFHKRTSSCTRYNSVFPLSLILLETVPSQAPVCSPSCKKARAAAETYPTPNQFRQSADCHSIVLQ
mmetsp:Transcript_17224/g.38130  ORF Transcript_17224/g.38130 Transcript_17224/m.38130 type:complete len:80 (-) Transcript_17224:136-375(-)